MSKILRQVIRETLIEAGKKPKQTHKSRFFCPKHGTELASKRSGNAGKFYGCKEFHTDGCDFSVEGDPPHRAFGDVAKDFNMEDGRPYFGRSVEPQLVPTVRHATETDRAQKYYDLLSMNLNASSDFRVIRDKLLPQIHKIGLKKKTIDDVRSDIEQIRSTGKLG